jgi:hypothetical protein
MFGLINCAKFGSRFLVILAGSKINPEASSPFLESDPSRNASRGLVVASALPLVLQ